jgi:hypothetical protein
MAAAVGMNDIAKMLSTRGGDISTIGGAIGCMTAMISADAREKDNTTSNDVKQIKEFICGDGGTLSSLFQYMGILIQEQTKEIQKLAIGNKSKKLVKDDITKSLKKVSDGIESKLDKIIDSLKVIASSQGGNVKWGNAKKFKDSVEKFKDSIKLDKKKMKNDRIAKLLETLEKLKAVNLKDLVLFKPKMKLLEGIAPQISKFGKNLNAKNLSKASSFVESLPGFLKNLKKVSVLSKFVREKDLERIYKILGFGSKRGKDDYSILGLIDKFAALNQKKVNKAKKNTALIFGVVKDICFGIGLLVLFSPLILIGGILTKPLQWALFGFKGDGGLIGLLGKLADNDKKIKKANKAIMWMSLGFVALGIGLGVLFALTDNIDLAQLILIAAATTVLAVLAAQLGKKKDKIQDGTEAMICLSLGIAALGLGLGILFHLTDDVDLAQLILVAATTAVLALVTILLGKKKDEMKDGAEAMVYLAVGVGALGLGLGILFYCTQDVDLIQLLMVAATTVVFGLITGIFGEFKDNIKEGAEAMLWMSLGIAVLGISLGILFWATKDVTWEQIAMVGASLLIFGISTVVLGVLNKDGMIYEGAIAMAVMGAALIPFGFAMKLIMGSVKGLKWSEFAIVPVALLMFGGAVVGLGALMCTGLGAAAWVAGLGAIAGLGAALIPLGIAMKLLMKSAKEVDMKAIDNLSAAVTKIFSTFTNMEENTWRERRRMRKNAEVIEDIGYRLRPLAKSLKVFNDVAPDSIDKAMRAVLKIANFFFSPDSELNSMNNNFLTRIKARATANTIGNITRNFKGLADGLRVFNDVAPDSIDKAMRAIQRIADYFFQPKSLLNSLFRRSATKDADAIGKISGCVYNLAKGLKDFNEVGNRSIDKAMEAIQRIANYFFSPESVLNNLFRKSATKKANAIGIIADNMYKVGEALKTFKEAGSKSIDYLVESVNRISKLFFRFNAKPDWTIAWSIRWCMKEISEAIEEFADETEGINPDDILKYMTVVSRISNEVLASWKDEYTKHALGISTSINSLVNAFEDSGWSYIDKLEATKDFFKQMSNPFFVAAGKTLSNGSTFLKTVDKVDMDKVTALKDMFDAFSSIGSWRMNIFGGFDKRVKQFTEACIELVRAINGNTEAINNSDEEVTVKNENGEEQKVKRKDAELLPKQMKLLNVDELAMAIADQMNSLNVDCDANVNLQINNENGNEWRISRM